MDKETERQENFIISLSGAFSIIRVTKKTIRGLGLPQFLKLLVNETYDELVITPCQAKEPMSFKVPERFNGKNVQMRIVSKAFVEDVLTRNGYDLVTTHRFLGKYLNGQKNAIVFSLKKEAISEEEDPE